ncbi:response regulator [Flavobacterium sp.]|uniref:response regulator n=1 Tax=Flavobacterium sp. TaxID=239 RepID=UPI00375247FC
MQEDFLHIMLADDDQDDRDFFSEAFDDLKIKTRLNLFNDGQQLMNYLLKTDCDLPHILFLDLNMPIKSGIECLLEIKQEKHLKDIAIAIYSTSASEEDIEETFINGANIYIKKPSDFKVLKKVLSDIVTINWHYQTSGLNKDNFLLKM